MVFTEQPTGFEPDFEVVGLVGEYDDSILLLQRALHDSFPGHWGLPAGGKEPEETAVEGVCREVYEETQITVAPELLRQFDPLYVQEAGREFLFHMFYTRFTEQPHVVLDNREHAAFAWVAWPAVLEHSPLITDLDGCLVVCRNELQRQAATR